MMTGCWLERADGLRLKVGPGGVLLGRSVSCHVVIEHPRVSKRHALLRLSAEGPELIPLGRFAPVVDGSPVHAPTILENGQTLSLPGEQLRVHYIGRPQRGVIWSVRLEGGVDTFLHLATYSIGGGAGDALFVEGWPEAVLQVSQAQGALFCYLAEPATLDGVAVAPGESVDLQHGAALTCRDRTFRFEVDQLTRLPDTVIEGLKAARPDALRFTFQPVGGELLVRFKDDEFHLLLSELRARLIAVLLRRQGDYTPGEPLDDQAILSSIWPGEDRDRKSINQLLHRIRADLIKSGLDPSRLLERPRRGGWIRVIVEPDTLVEVI